MSERMRIAQAYEKALFAGRMDEVGGYFTDDIVYWVAGEPPIGGEWRGREAVLQAFSNREFGLGAADWGYDEVWRDWYDAEDRVIVEIRERSWLEHAPDDVIDQRTCVVIRFHGDRICEMRDYSDSAIYEAFRSRHPELPKFAGGWHRDSEPRRWHRGAGPGSARHPRGRAGRAARSRRPLGETGGHRSVAARSPGPEAPCGSARGEGRARRGPPAAVQCPACSVDATSVSGAPVAERRQLTRVPSSFRKAARGTGIALSESTNRPVLYVNSRRSVVAGQERTVTMRFVEHPWQTRQV